MKKLNINNLRADDALSEQEKPGKRDATENLAICDGINFAASEAYKRLRTNLLFSFADKSACRIVGVTSSLRGEGKSVTSINLAYTMAQNGKRVLLIDCDMRLPTVAKKLEIEKAPGLSNLLVGVDEISKSVQRYFSEKTGDYFDVIPAGELPPNPAELLGSARMGTLLNALKEHYDYIFLDLPPVCAVADALIISKLSDGMIVVVRQDFCRTDVLREAMEQLKLVEANIIGFVYNGTEAYGGKYGKHGKYGKYGKYSRYYSKNYGNYYKTPESYETAEKQ